MKVNAFRFAAPAVLSAMVAWMAGLYSPGAHAACYVVYGAGDQVVYRSPLPPVDLSRNLHETVPAIVPGGKLVFWLGDYGCENEIYRLPVVATPATPARGRPAGARRG